MVGRNIMSQFTQVFRCINDCLPFETLTAPSCCCHCGTAEVYPVDSSAMMYDTPDEIYERHIDRTERKL